MAGFVTKGDTLSANRASWVQPGLLLSDEDRGAQDAKAEHEADPSGWRGAAPNQQNSVQEAKHADADRSCPHKHESQPFLEASSHIERGSPGSL